MTENGPNTPLGRTHEASPGQHRARLGFRDGQKSTHSSRTMMFADIDVLLACAQPAFGIADYRRLAVEDNLFAKPTRTTREHTVRKLKALYGLEPNIPLFRTLAVLWPLDAPSRPLLALLAAYARDPLLRLLAPRVLAAEPGELLTPQMLEEEVARLVPGRFSESSARAVARRVLATFTQSGHLAGKLDKRRVQAHATPVNAAYAFFLAYLEGMRAQRILASEWAQMLDLPPARLSELAREAARRGLMDFRQVGRVVELRFPDWLSPDEEELTRER